MNWRHSYCNAALWKHLIVLSSNKVQASWHSLSFFQGKRLWLSRKASARLCPAPGEPSHEFPTVAAGRVGQGDTGASPVLGDTSARWHQCLVLLCPQPAQPVPSCSSVPLHRGCLPTAHSSSCSALVGSFLSSCCLPTPSAIVASSFLSSCTWVAAPCFGTLWAFGSERENRSVAKIFRV